MHGHLGPYYGLDHDNFCGLTPQVNAPSNSWAVFFRERRLMPQIERALEGGHFDAGAERELVAAADACRALLGMHQPPPSLVHGDLWYGNVIGAGGQRPALIDPAAYFGDRETDMAFSRLFGGFDEAFYIAYAAEWPCSAGWERRAELYNLYHLLNHVNLFGRTYAASALAAARRVVRP
jgi:fructosamine-3-kinase